MEESTDETYPFDRVSFVYLEAFWIMATAQLNADREIGILL